MRLGADGAAARRARRAPAPNTFALAAIPARYAMERQQWADAAALTPSAAPNTPYTEAITHFARAIGAARAGKPDDAAADIARLAAIRDREIEMKDAYWAEQVDIQRRVAEAWVMFAEGEKDERDRGDGGDRRRRGRHRQVGGDARPARAGARAARLHAAREPAGRRTRWWRSKR